MGEVRQFPENKKKRKPINIKSIEQLGFLNKEDRDLWITDEKDLMKIMQFIIKEKITIYEDLK